MVALRIIDEAFPITTQPSTPWWMAERAEERMRIARKRKDNLYGEMNRLMEDVKRYENIRSRHVTGKYIVKI